MSDINIRYIVREYHSNFEVIDQRLQGSIFPVCVCHRRADAGKIAGLLNKDIKEEVAFREELMG